jgi:hypothetical protein
MTNVVSIAQSGANNVTMRNRVINGRMSISQRGTSFSTRSGYTLDRWTVSIPTPTTVATTQSTDAPTGFTNSLLVTVTTGGTIGVSANYIAQFIEGNNVADFSFGTSSASTATISFWVKSSVAGTFGASLRNYTEAPATTFRGYPFTYTITSANTWEQKTVTIAGDGTGGAGQWNTGTQGSFSVFFDLGSGGLTGTANAWASSNLIGVTGTQTSLMTGSGNTFYITGVQLEKGTTATPFEQRLYGTELALCQRYYYAPVQASIGDATAALCMGMGYNTTTLFGVLPLPNMRVTPTISSSASGTWQWSQGGASYNSNSTLQLQEASPYTYTIAFTVASGVTTNAAGWIRRVTSAGYVNFSAEL